MADGLLCSTIVVFTLIVVIHSVEGYEKTLRKIVRNQSKMVVRPFSDSEVGDMAQGLRWMNRTALHKTDSAIGFGHTNTVSHRVQRPKISTILSPVEGSLIKTSHYKTYTNHDINTKELRMTRHTSNGLKQQNVMLTNRNSDYSNNDYTNNSFSYDVSVHNNYKIPQSIYFPPVDDHELQSIEQKTNSKEESIVIPEQPTTQENSNILMKGMFVSNSIEDKNKNETIDILKYKKTAVSTDLDVDSENVDFILQAAPVISEYYIYNSTLNPFVCSKIIRDVITDIDSQVQFSDFDIEPLWASRKHFWDAIYDSRYESLMRNIKWPPLKVILLPRTHVDSIWKKTFNQYYSDSVGKILSNIVKKLVYYGNFTFTWNEVAHLSIWWSRTTPKNRMNFKKLLKSGRLEITTGGWVEPDEATTHLFGLVHLLVEGLEWLKTYLNYSPQSAWLTNTVAHSPTMTYLLAASDITKLVFTNVHYSWEQYLAEFQISDFVWAQSWDDDKFASTTLNNAMNVIGKERYSKNSVLTHYIPFNSAGYKACGPNSAVCSNDFNFAQSNKNLDINNYNVKDKSELLLEQYSKTGTLTPHNTIIAPLGGPYVYESLSEFDYQYNNYDKIATFINYNRDIYKASIQFGTPKDYFDLILKEKKKYPSLKGDFLNFADVSSGTPAYWTGYYTSRPFLKIMIRRLESTLRTTDMLFAFALNFNTYQGFNMTNHIDDIVTARESVARLLDRNVVSGTLPAHILRYVHNEILKTVRKCWKIQEAAVSFLTSKPEFNKPYLHKYVFREGEFISSFKTIAPEDQIYLFNSLSYERTEVIELITRIPNLRVIDHNKKEITVQLNPVWKYTSDNLIQVSKRFFKINFAVVVPPMSLELFKIKATYDSIHSAASIFCSACIVDALTETDPIFPFEIQSIETGDIQLENYKHRLTFDEQTGFLKTVIEKETNIEKNIMIDFGAFRDANINAGAFLFNTNVSKPLHDVLLPYRTGIKTKSTMIVTGQILTEISSVYGRLLQHTVRIFNLRQSPLASAIYLETKVDYEMSPKNRELELFMSVQTDISNGNQPEIVTDNNGFQHTSRILNITRRIESNMYPITSMAFIQDQRSRLTYITDHAQGVTALQEGQLIVMMDRRVLYNDGRGTNEGLSDSGATCHRQYLLLENFGETPRSNNFDLKLPSLAAVYFSNSLNYMPDIYLVKKNKTGLSHYSFLPLIKTSFPCDVSVVTFRTVLRESSLNGPNSALLILQRRSVACSIEVAKQFQCNGESTFFMNKIMRNIKAVYKTNLPGTNKGEPLLNFNLKNFPPMELLTLRIYF